MATQRAAFKAILASDTTPTVGLLAILPGGVLDAAETIDGDGWRNVPKSVSKTRISPFAVIRWQASTVYQPSVVGSERQTAEVYFYQPQGYDLIERAITRVKVLLHRKYTTTDDRAILYTEFVYASGELYDGTMELGGASCQFARFMNYFIRS